MKLYTDMRTSKLRAIAAVRAFATAQSDLHGNVERMESEVRAALAGYSREILGVDAGVDVDKMLHYVTTLCRAGKASRAVRLLEDGLNDHEPTTLLIWLLMLWGLAKFCAKAAVVLLVIAAAGIVVWGWVQ